VVTLIKEQYKNVPKSFADKTLKVKLGKMSSSEIAQTIKSADVVTGRLEEVLKMLPDRERSQVRAMLTSDVEYAPVRGFPRVPYLLRQLQRKKKRVRSKQLIKERQLVASVSIA
jgi:hypothetical protein